ncbi:MAG: hypothetical protein GY722_06185 [bacterium]|nr:hypothetical protein [bacterium]
MLVEETPSKARTLEGKRWLSFLAVWAVGFGLLGFAITAGSFVGVVDPTWTNLAIGLAIATSASAFVAGMIVLHAVSAGDRVRRLRRRYSDPESTPPAIEEVIKDPLKGWPSFMKNIIDPSE